MRLFFREQIRNLFITLRQWYWVKIKGYDIHPTAKVSLKAYLDANYPSKIHLGGGGYVAAGVKVLAHDFLRSIAKDTYIGKNTFIGVNTIILPGVRIGDHCIIGAGSVVTKDIPANSIAVGNPCKVIKTGIQTATYGQLVEKKT